MRLLKWKKTASLLCNKTFIRDVDINWLSHAHRFDVSHITFDQLKWKMFQETYEVNR